MTRCVKHHGYSAAALDIMYGELLPEKQNAMDFVVGRRILVTWSNNVVTTHHLHVWGIFFSDPFAHPRFAFLGLGCQTQNRMDTTVSV